MAEDNAMPGPIPIGLFVGTWLPLSETFVSDQLRLQRRLHARVCARGYAASTPGIDYADVHVLKRLEAVRYFVRGDAPRFERALRGVHLVHAHFGTNGARALPFARALDCPLVVSFHGHDVAGLFPGSGDILRYGRYRRDAPALLHTASLLLCASTELADLLVQRFGADPSRVRVHRLGVDLTRFAWTPRPDRAPTLLMVGRLVEKKGMAIGLKAFAHVRRRHPEARLRIVGDGPLRRTLERTCTALGLQPSVTLCGALAPTHVLRELQAADVLMAPSLEARNHDRESGVLVLKEAAATGLACVGTEHGGIPEIIEHGRTGLLVPPGQIEPLARAVDSLLASHSLRTRLGAQARAKMEREYDAVRQSEAFETLATSVL